MTLCPPRQHYAADKLRARGGGTIVLSLVGATPLPWPHVYADSGRAHDWACLDGLHVVIATRPGLNAAPAIVGVYGLWDRALSRTAPYPMLVDLQQREVFHICDTRPNRWMRVLAGTPWWHEFFPAAAA